MTLEFRSIRSGSSGNCLMLRTDRTCVLIDCGIRSQSGCRDALAPHAPDISHIDAVVVTHLHGDHIGYPGLRVFERHNVTVRPHAGDVDRLRQKHFKNHPFDALKIRPYRDRPFRIGDFRFEPIPVPHDPAFLTHAFVVSCRTEAGTRKAAIVTDFCEWACLVDRFRNADFLYLESNHDPGLLQTYPNPNSGYHMKNENTARFLLEVCRNSRRQPKAVMLGHLSRQRNSRELALSTLEWEFHTEGVQRDFELHVAPRFKASRAITITR